jgi:FHA domain
MTVTPFVLSVLKYAFLVLLYFFVYRALRTVVTLDLSGGRKARKQRKQQDVRPVRSSNGRSRVPTSVMVRDADGRKLGTYKLSEPLEIGRSDHSQIRLDDTYVSSSHARLFPRNGSWFVEDLGSTNGTYLNQQRVQSSSEVHPGDTLKVGKTVLELRK